MRQVVEKGRTFPARHSQPGVHGAGTAMDGKQTVGAVITAPCRKPFISRPALYPVKAAHTRSMSVERSGVFGEPWRCHGDLSSLPSYLSDCQILRKEEDP